ncbi:MAG: ADP-ribosylglycohydrolase family protein [Candidatus Omnitrophica bacterium]|nr:ADP-ribosylglycohydrolase family protein [Candidatus Omnitrophota bacterium]
MKLDYSDKIYGCFLGKSIGGSIGGPLEGRKEFLDISYRLPEKILPNDDLDLQLVWLDILKKKGIKITADDLVNGWINNITYPFDEYGVVIANLKAGLKPPQTGIYNNWFFECMGAPIRSEIWGCIFPGMPEVAGYYAYLDASVDHWNEGVYGEVFLSIIESIAFREDDIEQLIKKGCEYLPEKSKVRRVGEMVLGLYVERKDLRETREKILKHFGHYNFTHCVQNIGFIICGLLYGEGNFLKTIVEATRCGYDTDCTAATAGAVIGIILGKEQIERQIKTEIDDRIVAGWGIKDIDVPADIDELTGDILKLIEKTEKEENLPYIGKPFELPEISEFEKPLKIKFEISDVFEEVDDIEERILSGEYDGFKEYTFDTMFIPLERFFNGNRGRLFLKTQIEFGKEKKVKIYPATTDGIKMWIDKRKVLSYHQHSEFMPAPHRPGSPLYEAEMEKGRYEILLEIMNCNNTPDFAFIIADEKNHLIYLNGNKIVCEKEVMGKGVRCEKFPSP